MAWLRLASAVSRQWYYVVEEVTSVVEMHGMSRAQRVAVDAPRL